MDTTSNNKIDTRIIEFFQGTLNPHDTQELISWIRQSDENRTYFLKLKNLWESTRELPISTEKALQKVLKQIDTSKPSLSLWQVWQRVAAVLLIPLFITTLWLSLKNSHSHSNAVAQKTIITAPFGSLANFELPDGSKVWLNAGSSLEYPNTFETFERKVVLKGEAFFEVESNTDCPFYVSTDYFNVKATGTRFNVMAFHNDLLPSVALAEGKVAVLNVDTKNNEMVIATLKPNQHMVYHTSSNKVFVNNEDIYKYLAWKDGRLVFRNDLLSDVAKRISRQYNVEIEVLGETVQQYRFRASFENEPLNELLRLLKLSSPITYTEFEPKPLKDGTFSKRKIIIYSADK